MNKIPTLYRRNPDDRRYVTGDVTPGCEWVLAGEGVPTRKIDGTCMMLDSDGQWWARREVKAGKTPPANFVPVTTDDVTGKTMGWEPVEQSPFAKFHAEAVAHVLSTEAGTYELIGPKINGNPEGGERHELVPHDPDLLAYEPGSPAELIAAARNYGWEGVVWHHPDGRMAKLKVRDYPDYRDEWRP